MRKILLGVAAMGVILMGSAAAERAYAMAVGTPTGLQAAIDTARVTDSVHCRSYRHRHSRWDPAYHPWGTGCIIGPLVRPGIIVRPAPRRRVIIIR